MVYIKKFRVLFVSLILTLILSISCFARDLETVPFLQYFRLSGMSIQGVSASNYTVNTSNAENDIFVSMVPSSSFQIDTWAIRINSSDGGSGLRTLNDGDIVTFKMKFTVEGLLSTVDDFQQLEFYILKGNLFDPSVNINCGTIEARVIDELYCEFTLYCSYVNDTGYDMPNIRFAVLFNLLNNKDVSSRSFVNVFVNDVYDFYWGDPSGNPYLPSTQNPNETIGHDVNELKNAETELNNQTSQGVDDSLYYINSFGQFLAPFATSILAFTGVFEYFVDFGLFKALLYISLTLGLVMFVLNIIPSIIDKQDRINTRNAKEKARQDRAKRKQSQNKSIRFKRK